MSEESAGDLRLPKVIAYPFPPGDTARLLNLATSIPDGVVVLLAEDGAKICAIAPVGRMRCSSGSLVRLLLDLAAIVAPEDGPSTAFLRIDSLPIGYRFDSGPEGNGPGAGQVMDEVWVHPQFEELGIAGEVRDVIEGREPQLRTFFVPVYAILRYDSGIANRFGFGGDETVDLVKVVRSMDEAESECLRLNAPGQEDVVYFWSRGSMTAGLLRIPDRSILGSCGMD